jgi:hypothetical protein
MQTSNINAREGVKICAGKGCLNKGSNILEIKYLKKRGLFCAKCSADLMQSGLASKEEVI